MTGTSLDGIDAAVVEFVVDPAGHRPRVTGHASGPLGGAAGTLRALAGGEACTAAEIVAARRLLSDRTADVMLEALGGAPAEYAAVHGQTVLHAPPDSWQLIDATRIAAVLNCPVASNLRGGDLATGGQGAPITPLADQALFTADAPRAIINLGGFCNVTWLPARGDAGSVRGCDVCPCNLLLDAASHRALGVAPDDGGRCALAGTPDPALTAFLRRYASAGRSLGTGDEAAEWLDSAANAASDPATLLASIAQAVGAHIAKEALSQPAADIVLAGGGARNVALTNAIDAACDVPVRLSDAAGVPIETREAACVAILAYLDSVGRPLTDPGVTGRTTPAISAEWCAPVSEEQP